MLPNATNTEFSDSFPVMEQRMPALFVGHGSPMNAIEDNDFSQAWIDAGKRLPAPKAILCISAHWETPGTQVTAMEQPKTIHDFGGFPRQLFEMQYPAPGSPDLARLVQQTITSTSVSLNQKWGLDHGTWSVLCRMFPLANIPVIQLSLDQTQPPEVHYNLAKQLRALRQRGILILGSGNIVHNLGMAFYSDEPFDWATEFDSMAAVFIETRNHEPLIHYQKLGRSAQLSIPTNEHYLPLLYILAQQQEDETARFFANGLVYGSISMRSIWIE